MVGYHNWNEEAIEAMVENLSGPWEAFTEVLRGRSGMVAAFINEALAEAVESRGEGIVPRWRRPRRANPSQATYRTNITTRYRRSTPH